MQNDNEKYILNFWWAANYGANLTAYALNSLIKDSVLVDNSDKSQVLFENRFSYHKKFQYKYFNKIIKLTPALFINNKDNNTFIVGSDQVFRPCLNKKGFASFMMDYVNSNSKKIAFSASFGGDKEQFLKENSTDTIESMKKSLQTFDFVSVREKSGVEICRDIFGIDAEWIIDPVFILDKNKWNELTQDVSNKKEKYNDKIVSFVMHPINRDFKLQNTIELYNKDITIEEWLYAIKNCKYLITDSYHAMSFAIIFNKPFIAVANKERAGSRFDSVFEMLGIKNQCIRSLEELKNKDCVFNVDYDKVNKRIEKERQRGLDFLKKVLDTPVTKQKEKQEVRTRYLEQRVCELEQQANLSYQIKKELWNLWLVIWYKYLPKPVKFIINIFRGKKNA